MYQISVGMAGRALFALNNKQYTYILIRKKQKRWIKKYLSLLLVQRRIEKMKRKSTPQPEGNFYDKYHSANKIEKKLMDNFFAKIIRILNGRRINPKAILEAGCGEGHVTGYLANLFKDAKIKGFDVSETVIEKAKNNFPEIEFEKNNIYKTGEDDGKFDLVVACEVLEHLEKPEKALEELRRVSAKYILISVPREPLWRFMNMMRGKYISDFGNTPGHIQHWGKKSMLKFLNTCRGIKVIGIECPIPWIMFLIEKK